MPITRCSSIGERQVNSGRRSVRIRESKQWIAETQNCESGLLHQERKTMTYLHPGDYPRYGLPQRPRLIGYYRRDAHQQSLPPS